MHSHEVAGAIETIVREIAMIPVSDETFGHDTELFDSGYIESLGLVQLTDALERFFSITFSEKELFDQRFSTVCGISQIVTSRQQDA